MALDGGQKENIHPDNEKGKYSSQKVEYRKREVSAGVLTPFYKMAG